MINDVGEKSIEHLQCRINFLGIIITDKFEDDIKKWLPNSFILEFIHSTLDLNENISKFMNKIFIVNSFNCIQESGFHVFLNLCVQYHP